MQDNLEKHLDKLAKKVMTSSSLEQSPLNFTSNIMAEIEASTSKVTTYKPLISKRVWFVIVISVIGLVTYFSLGNNIKSSEWFNTIDLSVFSNNKVSETLSSFTFNISNTVMYAIAFFGLAFLVQITLIKRHHNKQLKY